MSHLFRAFWPLVDPGVSLTGLLAEARADLPRLTAQAHARLTGPQQWRIVPSTLVPGSGRVTELVLMVEAPAAPVARTVPKVDPLPAVEYLGRHRTEVDPAVVDRILCGHRMPATPAERRLAMETWIARGGSERSLCQAQGWNEGRYAPKREEAVA